MEDLIFVIGRENLKKKLDFPKILFTILFCVVLGISFYVYFFYKKNISYYQSLEEEFETLSFNYPPRRGNIIDRYGKIIVESLPAYTIYINFQKASEKEKEIFLNLAAKSRIFYRGEYAFINFLDINDILFLLREKSKYPNLELLPSFKRKTHYGEAVGHLVGHLGFRESSDIFVGVDGLEKQYDDFLRGTAGKVVYFREKDGNKGEKKEEKQPRDGFNLKTTIWADFQKKAYELIRDYFNEHGYKTGAFIALNPKTGEIYSLISYPSYNPDVFLYDFQRVSEILNDKRKPLFNRAISGLYTPGSTIKPLVAIAALEENLVTAEKQFYASGELRIPHPYLPGSFSIFRDNKIHGWTDLKKAIANSVNVYFYIIGGGFADQPGLGINRLLKWWKIFELDKKSGIDLPNEKEGFLPTPENKYKLHPLEPLWLVGDTYNVSIGQGDLLVTLMRIALWTAALSTNKLVRPYLLDEIFDQGGQTIFKNKTFFSKENFLDETKLKIVQEAMRQTVISGTGKLLADLPISVAGKSGTPEIFGKKKLNAIFTGYAPYEDPEVVMTILIEEAPYESSAVTLPLYKQLMKTFFEMLHNER